MRMSAVAVFVAAVVPLSTASSAELIVTMSGDGYRPASLSVAVGDTIRFVNDSDTDHAVFIPTAGFAADLGKQEPGSEKVLSVGKAGRFEVECVFHAHMHASVEVK